MIIFQLDSIPSSILQVNQLMKDCWIGDPNERPEFDGLTLRLAGYISTNNRRHYDSRSRLDSGISDCDYGQTTAVSTCSNYQTDSSYINMTSRSGAASPKYSSRSGSSTTRSSSYAPSPKTQRTVYWSNYKIINGSSPQVFHIEDRLLESPNSSWTNLS